MSDDCESGTYTTPNGLEFDVTCEKDVGSADIRHFTASSLSDCINECSTTTGDLCHGVVYRVTDGLCFIKNADIRTDDEEDKGDVHLAIANSDQLKALPVACPFGDESLQRAKNGLEFKVSCDMDYTGDDYNFSNKNGSRIHTETMQECIEVCSTGRPLCLGVAWNPDVSLGYANCYPKSDNNASKIRDVDFEVHAAIVPTTFQTNGSCSDSSAFEAGGKIFQINCVRTSDEGNDIATFYEPNLGACMERCAGYSNENPDALACNAAIYDGSARNGYENCYLRNQAGELKRSEFSIAVVTANSTGGNGAGGSAGNGAGAGLIAGPVVGGLAVIVLLVGGIWWWRRRKRRRGQHVNGESDLKRRPTGNLEVVEPAHPLSYGHEYNRPQQEPSELETVERPQELRN